MKYIVLLLTTLFTLSSVARAVTPEQEAAFIASYRAALEKGDEVALASYLYTKGAEPETVEFFKMMQGLDPSEKIVSIELIIPDAAQAEIMNKPMEMPNGKSYKMPFKPSKQLVVKRESKTAENKSTSTSKYPVGEKDGRLVIPVPVPVTK